MEAAQPYMKFISWTNWGLVNSAYLGMYEYLEPEAFI